MLQHPLQLGGHPVLGLARPPGGHIIIIIIIITIIIVTWLPSGHTASTRQQAGDRAART